MKNFNFRNKPNNFNQNLFRLNFRLKIKSHEQENTKT